MSSRDSHAAMRPALRARRVGMQQVRRSNAARRAARALLWVAAVAGLWQIADGFFVHTKAWLAQALVERAWELNRTRGAASARPWRWADTAPVARLDFVRQRATRIVLAGDSGRVLAFGPGHRHGSPLPGRGGNSVVSGHRDTHFAVLRELQLGDAIEVDTIDGTRVRYRVSAMHVVHERALGVVDDNGEDELTLVTCWPFDAVRAGGPLRYVVSASRASSEAASRAPVSAATPLHAPNGA